MATSAATTTIDSLPSELIAQILLHATRAVATDWKPYSRVVREVENFQEYCIWKQHVNNRAMLNPSYQIHMRSSLYKRQDPQRLFPVVKLDVEAWIKDLLTFLHINTRIRHIALDSPVLWRVVASATMHWLWPHKVWLPLLKLCARQSRNTLSKIEFGSRDWAQDYNPQRCWQSIRRWTEVAGASSKSLTELHLDLNEEPYDSRCCCGYCSHHKRIRRHEHRRDRWPHSLHPELDCVYDLLCEAPKLRKIHLNLQILPSEICLSRVQSEVVAAPESLRLTLWRGEQLQLNPHLGELCLSLSRKTKYLELATEMGDDAPLATVVEKASSTLETLVLRVVDPQKVRPSHKHGPLPTIRTFFIAGLGDSSPRSPWDNLPTNLWDVPLMERLFCRAKNLSVIHGPRARTAVILFSRQEDAEDILQAIPHWRQLETLMLIDEALEEDAWPPQKKNLSPTRTILEGLVSEENGSLLCPSLERVSITVSYASFPFPLRTEALDPLDPDWWCLADLGEAGSHEDSGMEEAAFRSIQGRLEQRFQQFRFSTLDKELSNRRRERLAQSFVARDDEPTVGRETTRDRILSLMMSIALTSCVFLSLWSIWKLICS